MTPRAVTVVGGGAVGLTLAARLGRGGTDVTLCVRRAEAARALADGGLHAEDAATGESFVTRPRVLTACRPSGSSDAPILVCTRRDEAQEVIQELARAGVGSAVTFQNDVVTEAEAAAHLGRVVGGVWRETCTRLADDRVRFQTGRRARAIVGLHPKGRDADVDGLAELLRSGDIDVGVSEEIARDKWLKLCVNLTSAPNALVVRSDHATPEFVALKVALLEEARAVLSAAGIVASSCDGHDRSLADEIAHHRGSLERGESARSIPLFNQVWASLRHRRPLESDGYHSRILTLAADAKLAAPANERVLEILRDAAAHERGPECVRAADLLPARPR